MNRRRFLASTAAGILTAPTWSQAFAQETPFRVKYFRLDAGVGPHDVTPAPDGTVWFCGQRNGALGRLDPRDGSFKQVNLGKGAAPHGVIIGARHHATQAGGFHGKPDERRCLKFSCHDNCSHRRI